MKRFNIDFVVGLFMIAGFLAFVYISLQMGEFSIFSMEKNYILTAEFDSVSGLKQGANIEIAGVNVGRVANVVLNEDNMAVVTLLVSQEVKITDDAIASIRTQGIIGDKYVKIIQGGSDDYLNDGDILTDTESAIDLEELVSKYIFGDV